jgi:hypothetical protein
MAAPTPHCEVALWLDAASGWPSGALSGVARWRGVPVREREGARVVALRYTGGTVARVTVDGVVVPHTHRATVASALADVPPSAGLEAVAAMHDRARAAAGDLVVTLPAAAGAECVVEVWFTTAAASCAALLFAASASVPGVSRTVAGDAWIDTVATLYAPPEVDGCFDHSSRPSAVIPMPDDFGATATYRTTLVVPHAVPAPPPFANEVTVAANCRRATGAAPPPLPLLAIASGTLRGHAFAPTAPHPALPGPSSAAVLDASVHAVLASALDGANEGAASSDPAAGALCLTFVTPVPIPPHAWGFALAPVARLPLGGGAHGAGAPTPLQATASALSAPTEGGKSGSGGAGGAVMPRVRFYSDPRRLADGALAHNARRGRRMMQWMESSFDAAYPHAPGHAHVYLPPGTLPSRAVVDGTLAGAAIAGVTVGGRGGSGLANVTLDVAPFAGFSLMPDAHLLPPAIADVDAQCHRAQAHALASSWTTCLLPVPSPADRWITTGAAADAALAYLHDFRDETEHKVDLMRLMEVRTRARGGRSRPWPPPPPPPPPHPGSHRCAGHRQP